MRYVSSRGGMKSKTFKEVLLMGLAPNGGLVMPEKIPFISEEKLNSWQNLSYHDLAYEVFSLYIDDIPSKDLKQLINNAYSVSRFGNEEVTPVRYLSDNLSVLELSNGPTLAFKDIAMQFLGEVFEYVLEEKKQSINILGATSGDTGSAAQHAMLNKQRVNVFMLSPHGRMSKFQQAQMFGLDEPNIFNLSIKGVFDDCQDIVKSVNADKDFKKKYNIGAVNSINWARILAQTVYYFKSYFEIKKKHPNQLISFSVPSGNFGNVYSGFVAKQMGLPIHRLIVATNENNVLDDFFKTGIYKIRASESVLETSSPSMDIGKASNFERFIYNLFEADSNKIKTLWDGLNQSPEINLSNKKQYIDELGFVSFKSTHQNRLDIIKSLYTEKNDLVDPHTADGIFAAKQYHATGANEMVVCLETALPEKFEETIEKAIGVIPDKLKKARNHLSEKRKTTVLDNQINEVKNYIVGQLS